MSRRQVVPRLRAQAALVAALLAVMAALLIPSACTSPPAQPGDGAGTADATAPPDSASVEATSDPIVAKAVAYARGTTGTIEVWLIDLVSTNGGIFEVWVDRQGRALRPWYGGRPMGAFGNTPPPRAQPEPVVAKRNREAAILAGIAFRNAQRPSPDTTVFDPARAMIFSYVVRVTKGNTTVDVAVSPDARTASLAPKLVPRPVRKSD